MEGGGKWKILRDRLSFKGMACCGGGLDRSNTIRRSSDMIERDDEEEDMIVEENNLQGETILMGTTHSDQDHQMVHENQACVDEIIPVTATPTGMNLATALAAERQFRAQVESQGDDDLGNNTETTTTTATTNIATNATEYDDDDDGAAKTPLTRVSLMALLEEGEKEEKELRSSNGEIGGMCCVCMGRRKGAAFIPCGHTFCRVCSRELWLNRGSCPLCNRSILEILDIY